ncbi:MAG: hypothetical protein QM756_20620 [Polyangiaceae bacterium]
MGGSSTISASGGAAQASAGGTIGSGGAVSTTQPLPSAFGCEGLPKSDLRLEEYCVGFASECELAPYSNLLLVERSQAMLLPYAGSTRWQVVKQVFAQFPALALGGLNFSGLGAGDARDRCDPGSYFAPVLATPSTQAEVAALFDAVEPALGNPLRPALEGLLQFARQFQELSQYPLSTQGSARGRQRAR